MFAVRLLGVGQAAVLMRFCSSYCALRLSRLTGFSRLWAALSCSARDKTGAFVGFLEDIVRSALSIISATVILRTTFVPAGLSLFCYAASCSAKVRG